MQTNLTPTFDDRYRALRDASSDVVGYRGRRGTRYTVRGVEPALRALLDVPAASDVHSIACGSEICPGDEILFVRARYVNDIGRSRFGSGMSRRTFSLCEAEVLGSDPGPVADYDQITIRHNDGETEVVSAEVLALNGIWRVIWDDEYRRDCLMGIRDTQREIARCDYEQHGAMFFARLSFDG
jgi:hypothetical protein